MTVLDFVNFTIFGFGLFVTCLAVLTIVRHSRWIQNSSLSLVIVAFLADDIIDNAATLIFATNTLIRTLLQMEQVNDINPWVAAFLRLAIFGISFAAIWLVSKKAKEDEQGRRALTAKITSTLRTAGREGGGDY